MTEPHPLLSQFLAAARGHFPPVDGAVTVLPALPAMTKAVVAFTGHALVATDRDPAETAARAVDGFGGALQPAFLLWLADHGDTIGSIDVTLVARGTGVGSALPERSDLEDHYRVRHARRLRRDVRVHGDERGLITLSTGLGGRLELSVEAAPEGHGAGWGRSLIAEALALVPAGDPVFAGVSPGNARSLRAFLGLGFVPLGSETIIAPHEPGGSLTNGGG